MRLFRMGWALSCWRLCSILNGLSSSHEVAALGKMIDRSCTWRKCWKSSHDRLMGMPPKSSALPQSFLLFRVAYIHDVAITSRR